MALFKVMRGESSALSSQELHDGYAWYTVDEGGFYIDAETNNTVVRKKINDADNITVHSEDFQETNLKNILEGLNDAVTGLNISYNSETETLIFSPLI